MIARGARRKSCRYAACAQSLAYSEWTLYHKGGWYYANEGTTLALFDGLRADLDAMSLGFYFAELTEAVTTEESAAEELLRHLLNGLYALSALHRPLALVKAAFEWKLLSLAGYEPLVDSCAYCGCPEPLKPMLDVVQGVLRCQSCGAHEYSLHAAAGIRWPHCGISYMEIPSGCIPLPWGRPPWTGWRAWRRPSPRPSWSGALRRWTSTKAFRFRQNRIRIVLFDYIYTNRSGI